MDGSVGWGTADFSSLDVFFEEAHGRTGAAFPGTRGRVLRRDGSRSGERGSLLDPFGRGLDFLVHPFLQSIAHGGEDFRVFGGDILLACVAGRP